MDRSCFALFVLILTFITAACAEMSGTSLPSCTTPVDIVTLPVHAPIYPLAGESVQYTLTVENATTNIGAVRLDEKADTVDEFGNVTPGPWTIGLKNWPGPFEVPVFNRTFPGTGDPPISHSSGKLITYRFVLLDNGGVQIREHPITYAIDPYPPSGTVHPPEMRQAAPVYVQGDLTQLLDIIFIRDQGDPPEKGLDPDLFRGDVAPMIMDALFKEQRTKYWAKQFNFYINPEPGLRYAGGMDVPANFDQIAWGNGHALMHDRPPEEVGLDYTKSYPPTFFSVRRTWRGIMLHETGHATFGLADEYKGGGHWTLQTLTNNWFSSPSSQEMTDRCKPTGGAKLLHGGQTKKYKICDDEDQMSQSTQTVTALGYDAPCEQRVEWVVIQEAGGAQ